MNPKLNISEIIKSFPEQVVGTHGKPVYNLMSPFEVALRENQLRVVQAVLDLGPRIPAHYFVYALGESSSRSQSKIGGLPYRPRGLAWPEDGDGRPMEFVCQVDFTDSVALLPPLPGQIMLLFCAQDEVGEAPFRLEWYPLGITDLIQVPDLPDLDLTFPIVKEVAHCYLYETHDYPEAVKRFTGTEFESWKTLGEPCGSKIGGYLQTSSPGGCHVFTLQSIRMSTDDPYAFVNWRGWKPTSMSEWIGAGLMRVSRKLALLPSCPRIFDVAMISDLGCISVFQTSGGQLNVRSWSH